MLLIYLAQLIYTAKFGGESSSVNSPKSKTSILIYDSLENHVPEKYVSIPKGGSLCGSLGMSETEALIFARERGIKHWYDGGILYVQVFPGDVFSQINGEWQKLQRDDSTLEFNGFIPSF